MRGRGFRDAQVDHVVWSDSNNTYDEIYVYAAVWRAGIQILRFSWGSGNCDFSLQPLDFIETPGYSGWVHLRETEGSPVKTLLVSDSPGLRAYSYNY